MSVFQAKHRTACNDTSAAFPPALRSSAWMPRIPGALPHFNRFTTACVSTSEGGPQSIVGSATMIGLDISTPDVQLDIWWISLVQLLKVTGAVCLHFRLFCQEPTTLCSHCNTEGWAWMNAMCEFPCKQDENHLTTGDALPPHRFLAHRPPCPSLVHVQFYASAL